MTITNQIIAQSIGTGANAGIDLFPQKVTAQVTTSGYFLNGRITNGADSYAKVQDLRCWYTSSALSVAAASAPDIFRQQAKYLDIRPGRDQGKIRSNLSEIEILAGLYIYFWFDIPTVAVAQALSVDLVEV